MAGREDGRALYLAISRQLIGDITSGRYPVGSLLPPETKLAQKYVASRNTIREAMRILTDMGLVGRRPGVGTTVIATTSTRSFSHSISSLSELQQYAETTRLQLSRIEHVRAEGDLQARLACRPGKEWLRLEGWRLVGSEEPPLCWTEIFIDSAFREIEPDLKENTDLIFNLIMARFSVTLREVRQRIGAVDVPAELAGRLQVAPGSPALLIERRYFGQQSDPIEIAYSIHPGGRFNYEISMKPLRR